MTRLNRILPVAVGVLAAYELLLGLWMLAAPRSFFHQIAGFGAYPPHFIRDNATWQIALGATLFAAVSKVSWRVPLLALATLQGGLHSINHWIDVNNANTLGVGLFDAISLTVLTIVIAAMWRAAADVPEREAIP